MAYFQFFIKQAYRFFLFILLWKYGNTGVLRSGWFTGTGAIGTHFRFWLH